MARLPALDGLRALAVYLVVLFHAGVDRFAGGFIGVDVFFVLSGFLITRLLLVEQAEHGRIDLLRFAGRRIRRLLPAASLAVIATCVVFVAFSSPIERRAVLRDARASVFYVANWNFIDRGQDYFGGALDSSPFLHLWSLAVEEQFYVVWPIVMMVVARWWTRSARAARRTTAAVGALAVLGAVFALSVAEGDLIRAYYGTDTRAYQLLAGGAVAFALTGRDGTAQRNLDARVGELGVLTGVVGIVAISLVGDIGPVTRGVAATVAAVVTIASVASSRGTPWSAGTLGAAPLARLGDLSYGTYLWHWPIVIVLERTLVLGARSTAVVVAVVATALAKLSMDLVERPIRRRSAVATPTDDRIAIGAAVTVALAAGLLIVPTILQSDVAQLRAVDRPGYTPAVGVTPDATPVDPAVLERSESLDVPPSPAGPAPTVAAAPSTAPPAPSSSAPSPSPTTVEPVGSSLLVEGLTGPKPSVVGDELDEGDGCVNDVIGELAACIAVQGSGDRVLLVGDSHANKLVVAFNRYAIDHDLTMATVSMVACPWQRGVLYELVPPVEGARQICRDQRAVLYDEFIEAYRPDVVVVTSHDLASDRYQVVPSDDVATSDGLVGLDLVRSATARSVDAFVSVGARVVILEPLPNAPFDPLVCLDGADVVEQCAFDAVDFPLPDTAIYREIAADRARVDTVATADLACPDFPRCDAVVADTLVREDMDHLSLDFTLLIVDELMRRAGL